MGTGGMQGELWVVPIASLYASTAVVSLSATSLAGAADAPFDAAATANSTPRDPSCTTRSHRGTRLPQCSSAAVAPAFTAAPAVLPSYLPRAVGRDVGGVPRMES